MKKFILIPDSFKGTITAGEYCNISTMVLKKHFPASEIISLPLADGGEGTTDCFLQMDGYKKITTIAMNAFMEEKEVYYAVKDDVAVMEMAMCASLPSAKGRENPATTTTYGVGQLIRHLFLVIIVDQFRLSSIDQHRQCCHQAGHRKHNDCIQNHCITSF